VLLLRVASDFDSGGASSRVRHYIGLAVLGW